MQCLISIITLLFLPSHPSSTLRVFASHQSGSEHFAEIEFYTARKISSNISLSFTQHCESTLVRTLEEEEETRNLTLFKRNLILSHTHVFCLHFIAHSCPYDVPLMPLSLTTAVARLYGNKSHSVDTQFFKENLKQFPKVSISNFGNNKCEKFQRTLNHCLLLAFVLLPHIK